MKMEPVVQSTVYDEAPVRINEKDMASTPLAVPVGTTPPTQLMVCDVPPILSVLTTLADDD